MAGNLTFDRYGLDTSREIDSNGYLRVSMSNISKAQVRNYLGREIPDHEKFNLDPNKVYNVLCPKEELEKAAKTFNNLPLTREHIEVDVDDVPKEKIVGSLGDHATVDGKYLKNNLIIYDKKDIDLVLSGKKKELSCGYRYTPIQESGEFDGQHYDFKMTDIIGNHVALVKQGRAGRDVMVADSSKGLLETIKEKILAVFDSDIVGDAEEKKEDEVEWITVKGNHIPVGKGQSKEEAVKSFIESKKDGGSEKKGNQKKPEFYVSTENDGDGQYYTVKAKSDKKNGIDIPLKKFDTQKEAFEYKDEMDKKFEGSNSEKESSKEDNVRREKDAPDHAGGLGFSRNFYKEFDGIDIPKEKMPEANKIYKEFQEEYGKVWNEQMKSSQDALDKLGVEYGKKVADLVGHKEENPKTSTYEEGKRVMPSYALGATNVFYSQFKSADFNEEQNKKGNEIKKEYLSKYDDMFEIEMGKAHNALDKVSEKYGKMVAKLGKKRTTNDADISKQEKVGVVMKEFKEGELKSGSGEKVTDPKQAIAIALSEADKVTKDAIPEKQDEPKKAGEENALQQGEKKMAEEVKEEVKAEEKVETPAKDKPVEDACSKDAEIKKEESKEEEKVVEDEKEDDLKGKEKKAFAEGVDYGEKKEKEEPKKLDSEHESEGAKKADKEEKEKKEEMAKDSALVMDADALRAEGREQAIADFKCRDKARKSVRSIVGDVDIFAFDSAEDIYKFACKEAGMNCDEIANFKDAFAGLQAGKGKLAMDASPVSGSNDKECFKDIRLA